MAVSQSRVEVRGAFLDAAERLLIETSWADVTVRRLAAEAGLNHGLVHYYFGSMEEVFVQVLERFTSRLIERQRTMYRGDAPI
jgi:AcrR family transcriptional regulator